MPAIVKKPLYISKSIGALNEYVDNPSNKPKTKSGSILCKSALKLFQAAEESLKNGDEERSYILFMRFYNVIVFLKKTPDYHQDQAYYNNLVGKSKVRDAVVHAEKLGESLSKRYKLAKEEEEVRLKLEKLDLEEKLENEAKPPPPPKKDEVIDEIISSQLLFRLISSDKMPIVMDARSAEDFEASHMKFKSCINIPKAILTPGITSEKLKSKLPVESTTLWNKRSSADCIVLLDWSSQELHAGSSLQILSDAMCKWDMSNKLKNHPVLLKGGFEDWFLHYPSMVTNPIVPKVSQTIQVDNGIPDVLDLEYPDLDSYDKPAPKKTVEPVNYSNDNDSSANNETIPKQNQTAVIPAIDRTIKPVIPIKNIDTDKDIDDKHVPKIDESDHLPNTNQTLEPIVATKPDIRRELKPKIISNGSEKANEADEESTKPDENALALEKCKTLDESLKRAEMEKLKLKEENDLMKLKMDSIFKETEELKLRESKLELSLKENETEKLDLEHKMNNEKKKFCESEARRHKKPETKPKDDPIRPGPPAENDDVKVVKLKKDPETPPKSSGLSRSHSSPNIAQLLANEGNESPKFLPNIDRTSKPAKRSSDLLKYSRIQTLDVNAARQRNLMPVYGSQGHGLTGLKNLGNTCFMNSIIQCLANTEHLCYYFMSGTFRSHINRQNLKGTRGDLSEEFSVLIRAIWSNQYRSITPKEFKTKSARYIDVCAGYDQQDSHEFLTIMMEKLHQDVNTAVVKGKLTAPNLDNMLQSEAVNAFWKNHKLLNQSVISELFEGLMCSTLQCLHCSKKSFSFEEFMCLSLPIPSSSSCSLKDCLKQFFKVERMSGEAKWFCPACKTHRDAEKKMDICKLPKLLIVHLKRFSYDGMWRRKLQTHVDFQHTNLSITTSIPGPDSRQQYTLYGVSNHYGTLEGGHYTAFCKNNARNYWYKFDDHEVSEISPNAVTTSAAYILFYSSLDQESMNSTMFQ